MVAVVALLVGGLLGALLTSGAGRAGGTDAPEPGSIEAVAAQLAQGQQQDQAALAAELAEAAEGVHDRLGEVLVGLAGVAPVDGGPGEPATADQVATWTSTLAEAGASVQATGVGTDDHAVTRAALLGAVELLQVAVGSASVDGRPDLVARDRDAAVRLWQAGATRLDSLVVAAGGEHIHLFLAPDGDPGSVPAEFRELHQD